MSGFPSNVSFPAGMGPVLPNSPAPTQVREAYLKAFLVGADAGWVIEPATPRRKWMDAFSNGFPYRCLPLAMANQMGWVVRSPVGFRAFWNGTMAIDAIGVQFDEKADQYGGSIQSHFGGGVLTFSLPWLFRTPPGVALLVRGMTNHVVPGAQALDAIVETSWAPMTFTMNWQMTVPQMPVRFEKGDPVCLLTPIDLALIEQTAPSFHRLEDDPRLQYEYTQWSNYRRGFNAKEGRKAEEWQKDYMHGRHLDGRTEEDHRSKLELRPFPPKA